MFHEQQRSVIGVFNLQSFLPFNYLGIPVADDSVDTSTIEDVNNVSDATIAEVEGHSMDDIMPGTKPPPNIVVFVDVPEHTETELGSSVLLACRTASPVAECQWSWQPLPPVHLPLPDVSESPPISTSKCDVSRLLPQG